MPGTDAARFETIDPATGRPIKKYPETSPEELSSILAEAGEACGTWSRIPMEERASLLRGAARILRESKDRWASLMAQEMGKPIVQGAAEVEKSALACDYFADNAAAFLAPVDMPTGPARTLAVFPPIGIVLAVMPWNFPFWQVFRAAAPALMAGNTMLLKHASNVCGCSLAIQEVFDTAGFPRGVFHSVLLDSGKIPGLIRDSRVQAVTLTGSDAAGRSVARTAGEALKKVVLELGGSDPYVVLEDADLEMAAQSCADGKLINAGQSCIAAKRIIVVRGIRKRFEQLFVAAMGKRVMGDPQNPSTQIGPLARSDIREIVARQVDLSVSAGARILLGGQVPQGEGFFYPPTVLTEVQRGMPVFDEEVFGPVAAVVTVQSEEEAIRCANDTTFGLGAAIYTRDRQRGERIAREEIQAGSCFVNAYVRSDPRLPFGGIKASGFGRELSVFGIREFVNIKTIWIE
jgi:succinate-semialdehyde dehydrogenase/glutarate-semialdehyde dehydrogenase